MSYFLVPIASQLTNEESSVCRQMLAEVTKTLFKKVSMIVDKVQWACVDIKFTEICNFFHFSHSLMCNCK